MLRLRPQPHILACLFLALAGHLVALHAALFESYSFSGLGLSIPDGNAAGVANFQTISSSISDIQSVTVTLDISGDFNGDLYGYVQHSSGFTVLLNRVGRTSGNSAGYADSGFAITLSDAADHDVHAYQDWSVPADGSPLIGTWQPDGRETDPAEVLDSSSRTTSFSSFAGLDANGDWSLFLADVEFGGESTLNGWTLNITAVPEPINVGLGIFGGFFLIMLVLRSHRVRACFMKKGRPSRGL